MMKRILEECPESRNEKLNRSHFLFHGDLQQKTILMLRIPFVFFLVLFSGLQSNGQSRKAGPKIGLTLSGGGAKGLAHIGILKAIDSAGLNVDYITGTSMGAIIGAMYAVGYSADSIEEL